MVTIGPFTGDISEFNQRPNRRVQISREHGRSVINPEKSGTVFWSDKYGILFGAEDEKGTNMDAVRIMNVSYAPGFALRV